MPEQTNPAVFCAILVCWALLCGAFGAYKAFFEKPPDEAE